MVNDMHQLCSFYVKREKINAAYKDPTTDSKALEDYSSRFDKKVPSRNRSFSSFLSQQEAYSGFDSFTMNSRQTKAGRQPSLGQNLSSYGSVHSLSSFCTVNELEKSMSYVEKTAKKLLPILMEVKKRMIPDKKKEAKETGSNTKKSENSSEADEEDLVVDLSKIKNKNLKKKNQFDLKNILGYLN
mmetsp:Transcript_23314/g.35982  ORF Transcript_23314/g.35982 Transcript_23314/m.35982 type:complete len:186 (-) Transcript_23314:3312-3869(-)